MATTTVEHVKLPAKFAVEMTFNNRNGFCLVRTEPHPVTYDILQRESHENYFYRIEIYIPPNTIRHSQNIKKRQEHVIHWSYIAKQLKHNQTLIPIIKFTPKLHLPATATWSFIPIVERNNNDVPVPVPTPVPAPAPAPPALVAVFDPEVEPIIEIQGIPKHALRLILLGALIEGEECPISGNSIDISNGGVTSCFHLFEKNAIARWLAMPNSNKNCPICMQKCELYLLT